MPNLFVSYDLTKPEKDYPALEKAIEALGDAIRVHESLWFVKTRMGSGTVADRVAAAAGEDDKVIVVEARSVAWNWLPDEAGKFMQDRWER